MKAFLSIISIFLFQLVFTSCNSTKEEQNTIKLESPQALISHLNGYLDTIKNYSQSWNIELQRLTKNADTNLTELKNIRNNFEKFLNKSISEIQTLEDVGQYAKELKITHLKLLNVEKDIVSKFMTPFEAMNFADTLVVSKYLSEGFVDAQMYYFNENEALINVKTFSKLFNTENKIQNTTENTQKSINSDTTKK